MQTKDRTKPQPKCFDEGQSAVFHRMARERLLPVYHDSVTWAIHETAADYTTAMRATTGSAIVICFVAEVLSHMCSGGGRGSVGMQDPRFQLHARMLIDNLNLNLGLVPDDTPLRSLLGTITRDEALDVVTNHIHGLFERLFTSTAVLSPSEGTQEDTALMLTAGLVHAVGRKFDVTRSKDTMLAWVRSLITALGVQDQNLETQILDGPRRSG
jgi:hypothetical protein